MKLPARTPKQDLAFEYLLNHPYSILAMDPRLGKSRVIIDLQQKLKNNCLIICPGYLTSNWPKEILKWHKGKPLITVFKEGRKIYDVFDSDFVVISYDLAQKAPWLFEWADMIAIDEVHNLKSMKAKRTQYTHKEVFENSVPRLHLLSGTILKNRVMEFYSPLALTYYNPKEKNPEFLDKFPSEIDFADKFSYREEFKKEINGKYITIVKWSGLRNVDELKKHLKGRYIRIKADEKDLPPIVEKSVYVGDSDQPELLDAFNSYFSGEGKGSVMPELKAQAALQKAPFTVNYVKGLLEEGTECLLVYSDHVESCELIAKALDVPAITGKMNASRRSQLADDFQAGKINIICATIGSLKEGKDLFRAKDIVINDACWVSGDLKQVINRTRALNRTESRTVHKMLGSPQDETIYLALAEKQATIEKAT